MVTSDTTIYMNLEVVSLYHQLITQLSIPRDTPTLLPQQIMQGDKKFALFNIFFILYQSRIIIFLSWEIFWRYAINDQDTPKPMEVSN